MKTVAEMKDAQERLTFEKFKIKWEKLHSKMAPSIDTLCMQFKDDVDRGKNQELGYKYVKMIKQLKEI